jgi:hypothetical protein
VLVNGTDCGGLALDRFGNLHFVDRVAKLISKVKFKALKSHFFNRSADPVVTEVLYSSAITQEVNQVLDLHIDRDYLYWTNFNTSGHRFGAVHKAFT